jgi:hypothetical protein
VPARLIQQKAHWLITKSIGQAKDNLVEVLILNNQLSGCLPPRDRSAQEDISQHNGMNHLTFLNHSYFSFVSSVDHLSLAAIRLRQVANALCYLAGSAGRLTNLKLSHNYFTSAGSTLIKDGVLDAKHNRPGRVHTPRA